MKKMAELDQARRELEREQAEKREICHTAMDVQNRMMSTKLLLASKKKTYQASKKSELKEIDSIISDNSEIQRSCNQLKKQYAFYEEQLKLEREEIIEKSSEIKEADKLGLLLRDLKKEFLCNDN